MIKVLIVDDDLDVSNGLKLNIDGIGDIHVVGMAKGGYAAIEFCDEHFVDLVLMDFKMPGIDGIETSRRLKARHPEIKIVILTSFAMEDNIIQAIKANCSGYILKGHRSETITSIVHRVFEGFIVYDSKSHQAIERQVDKYTPDKSILSELTPQEVRIVGFVAAGKTDQEIAELLTMNHGHIRNKLAEIRDKVGARNSKELAVIGVRAGL